VKYEYCTALMGKRDVREAGNFAHRMQVGDIIAIPLKGQPQIALARVTGPYEYRIDLGDVHHVRKVEWVRPNVPRGEFKQDLLNSLGAIMTVCQIQRHNAAERFQSNLCFRRRM
jgi:restriction system protein